MTVKLKSISLLLLSVLFLPQLFAQKKEKPAGKLSAEAIASLHGTEDTLAILAYAVVNDSIEQERFAACKVLITSLVKALKTPNSFNYPFSRLQSLSIMAPPDSSFRIFTWQLFVNDSTYRYYGTIQMNQTELKLFPLIDRSFEMDIPPTYEQLTHDNWYGALYYNLRQFDTKEGRKYLLIGYDAFSFFDKRKVIDILSFDDQGKPIFGAPVFVREEAKPGPRDVPHGGPDAPRRGGDAGVLRRRPPRRRARRLLAGRPHPHRRADVEGVPLGRQGVEVARPPRLPRLPPLVRLEPGRRRRGPAGDRRTDGAHHRRDAEAVPPPVPGPAAGGHPDRIR